MGGTGNMMIELFGISGIKLIAFLAIMIPLCAASIAGLWLIVLCCIRDIREVNAYYKQKQAEIEELYK